jgi:hypothetical protein
MPLPGDFVLLTTPGLPAKGIRLVTRAPVNHAALLTDTDTLIEADPGGAREVPLSTYDGMPQWWSSSPLFFSGVIDAQRAAVVAAGRSFVAANDGKGIPYGWIDDACVGANDLFHFHDPAWMVRQLRRVDRLMCSQLVDYAWFLAGVHLFKDDRPFGGVSPGALLPFTVRAGF